MLSPSLTDALTVPIASTERIGLGPTAPSQFLFAHVSAERYSPFCGSAALGSQVVVLSRQ